MLEPVEKVHHAHCVYSVTHMYVCLCVWASTDLHYTAIGEMSMCQYEFFFCIIKSAVTMAVSYTHLDVYKRQV